MTILDKIVITKQAEIAQLKQDRPDYLSAPLEKKRSFRFLNTITSPGLTVIAEVKKASPSRGIIRHDFDPMALALQFEQNGAGALSVLTDGPYFQGNPLYIPQIRQMVPLPILRKEFIIDPIQVIESADLGADAILLIQALLSPSQCQSLIDLAHHVGLDVLLEVHNHEELSIALQLQNIDIIGINNRNLHTFEIDMNIASTLLKVIRTQFPSLPVVAESGYKTADDLKKLATEAFSAVLIGEGLATNPTMLTANH